MTTKLNLSTTYKTATNWLNGSLILCNEIQNDPTFWDNCRFNLFDDNDNPVDIFQTYLTNYSQSDVEFLEEHFNLLFSYSDKLDLFVLCVDHYGTSWDYVHCDTDLPAAIKSLGE